MSKCIYTVAYLSGQSKFIELIKFDILNQQKYTEPKIEYPAVSQTEVCLKMGIQNMLTCAPTT